MGTVAAGAAGGRARRRGRLRERPAAGGWRRGRRAPQGAGGAGAARGCAGLAAGAAAVRPAGESDGPPAAGGSAPWTRPPAGRSLRGRRASAARQPAARRRGAAADATAGLGLGLFRRQPAPLRPPSPCRDDRSALRIVHVVRDVLSVLLTLSLMATSSSIELEWVFFSETPSSGSSSRYFVSFDFQLPRQLVDSNLLHRESYLLLTRGDADYSPLRFSGSSLRTRTFGMIVRRTRVLYRTKLFRGLRPLAGHRFRRFRTGFQRLAPAASSACRRGLRPLPRLPPSPLRAAVRRLPLTAASRDSSASARQRPRIRLDLQTGCNTPPPPPE